MKLTFSYVPYQTGQTVLKVPKSQPVKEGETIQSLPQNFFSWLIFSPDTVYANQTVEKGGFFSKSNTVTIIEKTYAGSIRNYIKIAAIAAAIYAGSLYA